MRLLEAIIKGLVLVLGGLLLALWITSCAPDCVYEYDGTTCKYFTNDTLSGCANGKVYKNATNVAGICK